MVNKTWWSRLARTISGFAALWFSPATTQADPPENWQFLSFDKARQQSIEQGRRMFVYFGRHGCPTCARVNRESFTDKRVFERFNNNYVLAYVDSESGERLKLPSGERVTEMDLGIRHKIVGTPYFFFMDPDGTTILSFPGYISADQFLALDVFVDGEHYKTRTLEQFINENS
ncbi:MAG: thioredoxin fold domain-containing protein [Gammaproteobacteria bacterium]